MASSDKHYESIARQIGATNLLALRMSSGMSQSHFATVIGLSDRALRRYERGERELPLTTRLAIIQAFKIDPLASDQLAAELVGLKPRTSRPVRRGGRQGMKVSGERCEEKVRAAGSETIHRSDSFF